MKISRYQLSDDKDNYYRFQIINAIVPRFNGNIFSLLVKLLRIRLHRVISSSKLFRAIVKMGEEVLSRHVPCRFRSCKLLLGSKLANFFRAINTAALVVEANHISVIQSVNAIFHLRFLSFFLFFPRVIYNRRGSKRFFDEFFHLALTKICTTKCNVHQFLLFLSAF